MEDQQAALLLGIDLSDSDNAETEAPAESEADKSESRMVQSAKAFEEVRRTYKPKVENGEIWKSLQLGPAGVPATKAQGQAVMHAVEELYFLRRYAEAREFLRTVLERGDGGIGGELRATLEGYEKRCEERLAEQVGGEEC